MIEVREVKAFPQVLFDELTETGREELKVWSDRVVKRSPKMFLVVESPATILLGIGYFRKTLLEQEAEIWMLPTIHLAFRHIFELRRCLREYLQGHTGPALFARGKVKRAEQFLRFMGGELMEADDGLRKYRFATW